MKTNAQEKMKFIMSMAWMFVRKNGYTMSEALKVSWNNWKLRKAMTEKIIRFCFRKVDGSVREAYGTLMSSMLPPTKGMGITNPTTQVYYDIEKEQYRCFKKANLLSIAL